MYIPESTSRPLTASKVLMRLSLFGRTFPLLRLEGYLGCFSGKNCFLNKNLFRTVTIYFSA